MRALAIRIGLVAAGLLLVSCSEQNGGGQGPGGAAPAIEVGVIALKAQSVPRFAALSGRVGARATAEIRPQVDGIVKSIDFREGRPVKDAGFRLAPE